MEPKASDQTPDAEHQLVPTPDAAATTPLPQDSIRAEDILLERLKNQPPIKPQLSFLFVAVIMLLVIGLGVLIYFITKHPETFAEKKNPHASQNQEAAAQAQQDSIETMTRRAKFAPYLDSLKKAIEAEPHNAETRLHYANALYESSLWDEAKTEYETYLKTTPRATDARVDYAFVLTQTTHDFPGAVAELEKVLAIEPKHIKALFNAGLLSIQAFEDKKEAITKATSYFRRARIAAEEQHETEMVVNIDRILEEIKKLATNKPE